MIGQTVSHYQIIEKLGEGGMGIVYKAQDTKLNRIVALKFLPDRVNKDETAKARFLQESQSAAALNHPNICTIFNIEECDGSLFMVMEYVDGGTVRTRIPFGKVDDAIGIAIQIGEALQEAHAKGIVHRDIKADNIMLNSKGQAKVMDFGLAKLKGSLKLTRTSSTVGTLGYMAPEQIQGGEVDHRSDIFSFGVLLFEMLTGHLPFRGEHEAAMVYSIVNEEPQNIGQILPDTSPIIANLIQRCLEKDPAERYQHFDDVTSDLRRSQKKTTKVTRSSPDRPVVKDTTTVAQPVTVAPKEKSSKLKPALIGATVLALLAAAGIYFFKPSADSASTKGKTIAVLPFVNGSGNPDDQFFTEGVTEDILTQLSKVSELTVLSRFTLKEYDSKGKTPRMIGSELNVSSLLVGSIRRSGDRLRISCQLINTGNDAEIWAETYDRKMDDVFSVQTEIARKISASLQAQLTTSDDKRLSSAATTNTEAHNALLQGRYFYRQAGRENQEKAIKYFKEALLYDSAFAPAWRWLANTHIDQAGIGYIPAKDGFELARKEVERALQLDPDFADAYATLGRIKQAYDWDWAGADKAFKRGLELDPGNQAILNTSALLAATLGRFDEAIALQRRSIELEPLAGWGHANLGRFYMGAGRFQEAETATRRALELLPSESGFHVNLARLYLAQSRYEEAFAEMEKEPEPVWRMFLFPLVYRAMGRHQEANKAIQEFIAKYSNEAAYQIAEIYAFQNEKDKAFEWLERAYQQRDGGLSEMKGDPLLRNIENDLRYKEFLKKMKLPV